MASGSGPRAAGTDGGDHKFRQRVDDHYRLMADGRGKLGKAGRAHLVATLGLAAAVAATVAFAPGNELDAMALGRFGAPALLSALLGNLGRGASRMTDSTAAGYARSNAARRVGSGRSPETFATVRELTAPPVFTRGRPFVLTRVHRARPVTNGPFLKRSVPPTVRVRAPSVCRSVRRPAVRAVAGAHARRLFTSTHTKKRAAETPTHAEC